MNIFTTIGEDAAKVMKVLKLSITTVRAQRATRNEMAKRAILYCFLHYECEYNFSEIAFYAHKEHSTVRYSVKTYTELYNENKDELLHKLKEI